MGGLNLAGDIARGYLAILTVMMGGALALVTSRTMDSLVDRRKVRRSAYIALLRLQALINELEGFESLRRRLPTRPVVLNKQQVSDCIIRSHTLALAAVDVPDFDELLDSAADVEVVEAVLFVFRRFETICKHDLFNSPEEDVRAARMDNIFRDRLVDQFIQQSLAMLRRANDRFARRASN